MKNYPLLDVHVSTPTLELRGATDELLDPLASVQASVLSRLAFAYAAAGRGRIYQVGERHRMGFREAVVGERGHLGEDALGHIGRYCALGGASPEPSDQEGH